MKRTLKIDFSDILVNRHDASAMIDQACHHQRQMKVVGCCPFDQTLLIFMEESEAAPEMEHVIAPLPASSEDEIIGEVNSRFFAGFATVSGFWIEGSGMWGLFVRPRPEEQQQES